MGERGLGIRVRSWAVMAALGVLAASSAQAADNNAAKGAEKLAKLLEGRTAGAPVDCIETRKIITTEIFTGTAIVYRLRGSQTLYVNTPTVGAETLSSSIQLQTQGAPTLCAQAPLLGMDNGGRGAGPGFNGGVTLGTFIPYEKP
jgi:hypothetical protein